MMTEMRAKPGAKGMVTANGNYVTKQSAGIYSTEAPSKPFAPEIPTSISVRSAMTKVLRLPTHRKVVQLSRPTR